MQIRLLAFAQTRDALGFHERVVSCAPEETPRQIVARAAPALGLMHLRVAVDCEYHDWDQPVGEDASELALIPPVSGG